MQTPSFYNYCGNNPVSFNDPGGEWFWLLPILAGGTLNTVLNFDKIHNAKQFGLYFGLGALSGAVAYFSAGGSAALTFNSVMTPAIEAGMRKFALTSMAGAIWNIGYQRSGLSDAVRRDAPLMDFALNMFGPAMVEGGLALNAGNGKGVIDGTTKTSENGMGDKTLIEVDPKVKDPNSGYNFTTKGDNVWQANNKWNKEYTKIINGKTVLIRESDVKIFGIFVGTHTAAYTDLSNGMAMTDYSVSNTTYGWWNGICHDRSTMFINDMRGVSLLPSEIFTGHFNVGFYQHYLGAGYLPGSALYNGYLDYRKGRR